MKLGCVSIIVPCYNVAETVKRTIESILSQTYSNIEVLAVDDGSTDCTGAILDELAKKDERVRVYHIPNGGVTHARLTGCRMAEGEWIGFADGDDTIDADMYERLVQNALKYKADISHCGYRMALQDGRVNYYHNTGCLEQQDRTTALQEILSGEKIEPGLWNKLFRRELFQHLLQIEPEIVGIRINEDLIMNYYLFSACDAAVYEDFCPYCYIVREGSASQSKLNNHRIYDPIRVKQKILEIIPEELRQAAQKAYLSTCVGAYNLLVLAREPLFQEDRIAVRKLIREQRSFLYLLSKKQRFLSYLILYLPGIYPMLYRIYERYFQKKKYV